MFAIRAGQSHNDARRVSNGLTIYMQTTLVIGYISLAGDMLVLLRCLIVAATLRPMKSRSAEYEVGSVPQATSDLIAARAKERSRYRGIAILLSLTVYAPIALGTIAGIIYTKAKNNVNKVHQEKTLRYVLMTSTGTVQSLYCVCIITDMLHASPPWYS